MSTRFRVIYPYFKNSHNFVSLILIKKNQYPSFSVFLLYSPYIKEIVSSTSSHQPILTILFLSYSTKTKKRNQFTYSLTFLLYLERIVSSTLPPSSNLIFVREKTIYQKFRQQRHYVREKRKKKETRATGRGSTGRSHRIINSRDKRAMIRVQRRKHVHEGS